MGEADKPFACPLSECGMKFTNEDHLTVHKRKHDMCLNINNGQKVNVFVADQTPTPTRFIRNCEEVGLFQDLQNVNPFEEQFRKAAEAAKSGATPLHEAEPMCGPVDDTLHTPQVFPQLHPTIHVRGPSPEPALEPPAPCPSQEPVALLLRLPDGKLVKLSAVETSESESSANVICMPNVVLDESITSGSSSSDASGRLALAKQRLKQTISANRKKLPAEPELRSRPPLLTPSLPARTLVTAAPKRSRETSASSGDDSSVKRQKFLERNRAAASRCRQKRKHWVSTLQRRSDVMHATNQQLVAEVGNLRSEVAQLKSLLLAHRDCPVTKAMCQAGVLQLVETARSPSVIKQHVVVVPPAARLPDKQPGEARRGGVLKFVHQINKETVIIQSMDDKP